MKYIGMLSSAASGKLGGLVATHGRAGTQLRAQTMRRQPRTPAQTAIRAAFQATTSSWRTLTAPERASWQRLAKQTERKDRLGQTHTPTGFHLYTGCNRNLQLIAITTPLTAAPMPATLPSIVTLSAQIAAPQLTIPPTFPGFTLTFTLSAPTNAILTLRATRALSGARGNIRPSEYRTVAVVAATAGTAIPVDAAWTDIFGTLPPAGTIHFAATLTDPASGLKTNRMLTAITYTGGQPGQNTTVPVNIYVGIDKITTVNLSQVAVNTDTLIPQ